MNTFNLLGQVFGWAFAALVILLIAYVVMYVTAWCWAQGFYAGMKSAERRHRERDLSELPPIAFSTGSVE